MADTETAPAMTYKDKKGLEVKPGGIVMIAYRVTKLGGNQAPLLHLETIEPYGHGQGPTKAALWVEPGQIEVQT
jgi:hypothetical protein